MLDALHRACTAIAAELDLEKVVQLVTDAGRELTGAAFGAFFYNVVDEGGDSYLLYTLSGAPREAFAGYPMPRSTAVFGTTFRGEAVVRSDDITRDPRYGRNPPYHGMPAGHLPVRSYLAVPVVSSAGEVVGGLFYGHPQPGVFSELAERLVTAIAAQAAAAIANARLYAALEVEVLERRRAEQRLATGHAVSNVLGRAATLEAAASGILEAFGEHLGIEIAELWLPDAAGERLTCRAFHTTIAGPAALGFDRLTRATALAPGEGLPGRVWLSREPAWMHSVTNDPGFVRCGAARELGLEAGFAFPILLGDTCHGVLSFFVRKPMAADEALLDMMAAIGRDIGQFIERTRIEQARRFHGAIVEASEDAIIGATVDGIITSWNPAAERLFGYTEAEALGQRIAMIVPEDVADERQRAIEQLRRGERVEPFETLRLAKSGALIPVSVIVYATRDADGEPTSIIATARDISPLKHTRAQLQARVRQLEAVATLGQEALGSHDLEKLLSRAAMLVGATLDVEFCKILELEPGLGSLLLRAGIGWRDGLVGRARVDAGLGSQAGFVLAVGQPVIVPDLASETRFRAAPLLTEHGVVSGVSVVIGGEGDRPFGVLGAHTASPRTFTTDDIAFLQSIANVLASAIHRRIIDDQQRLLMRELSHRVKNILAVVQAIARQTAARASTVEGFRNALEGRLTALLAVHDLLTEATWQSVGLRALATAVLAPYLSGGRMRLEIEDLDLLPVAGQTFGLILHELATNASKYGALSEPAGQVTLSGEIRGDEASLVWWEIGGPPARAPDHQGFGTTLICQAIGLQYQGRVDFDWPPEGLICRIRVPLAKVAAPTGGGD
ncbi:MAG TPA: GAF domain-containing protein [Geminicoccaceae bacterium]